MAWRVAVSVVVAFFGATISSILWVFSYAGSYNAYQNIAIIVVILLAIIGVNRSQADWWQQGRQPAPEAPR